MKKLNLKISREQLADSQAFTDTSSSLVAIILGLLFGLSLMLIVNPVEAFEGFMVILRGGTNGGMKGLGNMLFYAAPIILTGLSVAFAFRTGLFNIGASGQLTMGALAAVLVSVPFWQIGAERVPNPLVNLGSFHWVFAVLMAILAGALWGAVPGILKATRNVNEVVVSIMMNYIAMYVNALVIYKFMYNSFIAKAHSISSTALIPTLGLDEIFANVSEGTGILQPSQLHIGIIIALVVVIIIHYVLNRTTFGYELKAVGFNRSGAKYAGMNAKRNIVLSMTIAGAIAGLAGAFIFLVQGKNLDPVYIILPQGFEGIAIALLGLSTPIGVFIAGLFFSSLRMGGYYLQLLNFKPEIIDIIVAVIIYFSALSLFLKKFIIILIKSEWFARVKEKIKGGKA